MCDPSNRAGDQLNANEAHRETEELQDQFRLALLRELHADLGTDNSADTDRDRRDPENVAEHRVAYRADQRTDHQNKGGGRGRDDGRCGVLVGELAASVRSA